jgi:hypothetical protein
MFEDVYLLAQEEACVEIVDVDRGSGEGLDQMFLDGR